MFALKALGVRFKQVFASDVCKHARAFIRKNSKPETLYTDILSRELGAVTKVDVYISGFPCQPFSSAGKQLGAADPRARVGEACLDYIIYHRPCLFILENVPRFATIGDGACFHSLL